MGGTCLFVLAHQDDEIGVLPEIERAMDAGESIFFAYLTNGATEAATSARRNAETLAVLGELGVEPEAVHFLGEAYGIGDGKLIDNLDRAYGALKELASARAPVSRMVFHGWEGGHQDHDAVHVVAAVLVAELGILQESRQFPLYRACLSGKLPYTMLCTLPANGPVEARRIPLRDRLRYVGLCLGYPSQARTFLGLLPFIVVHYIWKGTQPLQPVSLARLAQAPHPGTLLYQQWGRFTWAEFHTAVKAFLGARDIHGLRPLAQAFEAEAAQAPSFAPLRPIKA